MSYKIVQIEPNKNIQILYMSEFFEAVQNGDLDKVKRLFRPEIINTKDHESDTAILKASRNPNASKIVSFLLENGASTNDRGLIDETPLIVASQHGCRETVKILLSAGSDIHHRNAQGETALLSAIAEGFEDIVRILIDAGSNIKAKNADGETPLLISTKLRHRKELVIMLIDAGADINVSNHEGETPIMLAMGHHARYKDVVDLLMAHDTANGTKRKTRARKPKKTKNKSGKRQRKNVFSKKTI